MDLCWFWLNWHILGPKCQLTILVSNLFSKLTHNARADVFGTQLEARASNFVNWYIVAEIG